MYLSNFIVVRFTVLYRFSMIGYGCIVVPMASERRRIGKLTRSDGGRFRVTNRSPRGSGYPLFPPAHLSPPQLPPSTFWPTVNSRAYTQVAPPSCQVHVRTGTSTPFGGMDTCVSLYARRRCRGDKRSRERKRKRERERERLGLFIICKFEVAAWVRRRW